MATTAEKCVKKTKEKEDPKTQEIIAKAKLKGALTYDELDEILPEDATADQMDEVMVALGNTDVNIVDEFKIDSEKKAKTKKEETKAKKAEQRRDAAHTRLERADDPVRMYLREMGRVPLLTKDQEVTIAKRIEAAEGELMNVLLGTPYTLKEIQMIAARLLAGRLNFSQITIDEDIRIHHKFVNQLPDLMESITELDEQIESQEKRSRRTGLSR